MTIRRGDCWAHVVWVCPDCHDLIDAHVPHGKVFGGPHGATAAISGGSNAAAHIANVPGHVIGCHGGRRVLGNGIDDGIFDESWESVRNAQRVHREDQLIRADLPRWGGARSSWSVEYPRSKRDQQAQG